MFHRFTKQCTQYCNTLPCAGALIEYAVILFKKQKAHHNFGPPYAPSYPGNY